METGNYHLTTLDTAAPKSPESKILVVYTGGTFGMMHDEAGSLVPFDFDKILTAIPSLKEFDTFIKVISFKKPIDSSNVQPSHWFEIANIVKDFYDEFDGFVILHGTDTMAYSASALSFIFENLAKPVLFTGAQLPIMSPRTDARSNLVTSLEIASAKLNGRPRIPEVGIVFNDTLIRGNRAKKVESNHFDAFHSDNYPVLATSGVTIEYNMHYVAECLDETRLQIAKGWSDNVCYLKLFPGMNYGSISSILESARSGGVVLETFGSGNAPTDVRFLELLAEYISTGSVVFNVSQCVGGEVVQGKYETSKRLADIGVVEGGDITSEAAITKLMYLLGNESDLEKVKYKMAIPLRGEMRV